VGVKLLIVKTMITKLNEKIWGFSTPSFFIEIVPLSTYMCAIRMFMCVRAAIALSRWKEVKRGSQYRSNDVAKDKGRHCGGHALRVRY